MIANTNLQSLHEHLFAVSVLAETIAKAQTSDKSIHKIAFLAGFFHDIGKIEKEFQKWLRNRKLKHASNGVHIETGKFSFENHARHNEISLFLLSLVSGFSRKEKNKFAEKNGIVSAGFVDILKHSVYWHHAKPLRKSDFNDLSMIYRKGIQADFDEFLTDMSEVLGLFNALCSEYGMREISFEICKDELEDRVDDLLGTAVPKYKGYTSNADDVREFEGSIKSNARCNIVRSSLVLADQIVSSLSRDELTRLITSKELDCLCPNKSQSNALPLAIENHMDSFFPDSDRTVKQGEVSSKLAEKNGVAVLSGAAGCGKTKIGVEWALKTGAQKLYWIVPRVSVGQGVYEELSSPEYLPDCKIELFTGEYKYTKKDGFEVETHEDNYLSGDVVITTIDQLVNGITTHKNISIFADFMQHHAVFDEYHEYVNMNSFNLLFCEMVRGKLMSSEQAKALLISATPNFFFTEHMLDVDMDEIVEMESSNSGKYMLNFEQYNSETPLAKHPLYKQVPEQTIVISNTAKEAQKSFLYNLDEKGSALFHSKLASKDKREIFKSVFDSFKKGGTKEYAILRSAPIVQASLNITCFNMVSEMTTPENLLQRMGRLDRFGESSALNILTVAVSESVMKGKQTDGSSRFLARLNSFRTTNAWYDFLSEHANKEMTIPEFYQLYKSFYQSPLMQAEIEKDLLNALNESADHFNSKISDPIWIKPKAKQKEKLKKSSLRGDSRYVQMALMSIGDNGYSILNEYAINEDNQLTLSLREVSGDDSPLSLMLKKHHQIERFKKQGCKKEYGGTGTIIDKARESDFPIYASYTPEDIASVNDINCESATFYAITNKQAVGCVSIDILAGIFD